MRNIISFIVAAALSVGGLWTVCVQLFGGQIQEQLLGGGFLAVLGGGWLWFDFVRPLLGSRRPNSSAYVRGLSFLPPVRASLTVISAHCGP